MAVWRDISLLWLIFLTFVAILPLAVVFFFAVKGMHRLRQLVVQYLPVAQEKIRLVAVKTDEISRKVANPFIEVQAKAAEISGIITAIKRRKRA